MAFLTGGLLDKLSKLFEVTEGSGDRTTDSLEAISNKVSTSAELAKVPKSDSNVTWNATALGSIKTYGNVSSLSSGTSAGTIVQDGATGTPTIARLISSGSSGTFGAWTQMDASTAADIWISHVVITMDMGGTSATNFQWCVEIGTGGAGAEAAKIRFSGYHNEDSAAGHNDAMVFALPIPIKVASGTRIAGRTSDNGAIAISVYASLSYYVGLEK